jgi:hypothetical protein
MSTPCWSNHSRARLVVGDQELDLLAVQRAFQIGDRHAHRFGAAIAVDVRVHARQIGDQADFDGVTRDLGVRHRRRCAQRRRERQQTGLAFHAVSLQ